MHACNIYSSMSGADSQPIYLCPLPAICAICGEVALAIANMYMGWLQLIESPVYIALYVFYSLMDTVII